MVHFVLSIVDYKVGASSVSSLGLAQRVVDRLINLPSFFPCSLLYCLSVAHTRLLVKLLYPVIKHIACPALLSYRLSISRRPLEVSFLSFILPFCIMSSPSVSPTLPKAKMASTKGMSAAEAKAMHRLSRSGTSVQKSGWWIVALQRPLRN